MKTTAYQTWHKKALEETRVRPKVRVALMDACERLHVDAVRQPTGETVCTWWDLLCGGPERYEKDWLALGAAATYIRFLYAMGHLGIFTVPINAYPLADSEPQKMQRILCGALPDDWAISVHCEHGGNADNDGWVSHPPMPDSPWFTQCWGGMPLEIGSTRAWKTALHVSLHGGVARWPYDCPNLVILSATRAWWNSLHTNLLSDGDEHLRFELGKHAAAARPQRQLQLQL